MNTEQTARFLEDQKATTARFLHDQKVVALRMALDSFAGNDPPAGTEAITERGTKFLTFLQS